MKSSLIYCLVLMVATYGFAMDEAIVKKELHDTLSRVSPISVDRVVSPSSIYNDTFDFDAAQAPVDRFSGKNLLKFVVATSAVKAGISPESCKYFESAIFVLSKK